jgi:tetratricopeptide (TPR) repeat protein
MIAILSLLLLLPQGLIPEAIEHAQAGAAARQKGDLDTAIAEFRKVTELQPALATGFENLGESLFRKGEIQPAIQALSRAVTLNSDLRSAQQTLGVAMLVQGDAAGAIPHLEKNPSPELLGQAYLEIGNLGNALFALDAAVKRQPKDPDVLYYYGKATETAALRAIAESKAEPTDPGPDETSENLMALESQLAKSPHDPAMLAKFGRAAANASAHAFYEIQQSSPESARAHQVAAERLAVDGKLREAASQYAQALKLSPYSPGLHLDFARTLAALGDWEPALDEFRAECALRPASANAWFAAGSALLARDKTAEAFADLRRANEIRPHVPAILMALSRAAARTDDTATEERALLDVLDANPSRDVAAEAHAALAAQYRRVGKTADADREAAEAERIRSAAKH